MSKVQVDTIDTRSGTSTMQIGSTNTSTINIGVSGDTVNIPSGVTIANAGTATGFGGDNTPSFKATCSGTTTVANDENVKIAFNTEVWDTDSAFDTSNYRFTVPSGEGGKYFFIASMEINITSATTSMRPMIWKNGATAIRTMSYESYYPSESTSGVINLAAGDYVEAYLYHNSGGSQAVQTSTTDTFFLGYKLIGV